MTTGERSNAQWLEELTGRDDRSEAAALRELHRYLRAGLGRAFGDRLTEEDLDDHAQEAVMRVLDRIATFQGRSRFTTWAMAVAVRVTSSALRRPSLEGPSLDAIGTTPPPGAIASGPGPHGILERNDLVDTLNQAIQEELTERQRVVVLAELAGVPKEQVARQLDANRNALYKMGFDARTVLKRALERAGFSAEHILEELANWS